MAYRSKIIRAAKKGQVTVTVGRSKTAALAVAQAGHHAGWTVATVSLSGKGLQALAEAIDRALLEIEGDPYAGETTCGTFMPSAPSTSVQCPSCSLLRGYSIPNLPPRTPCPRCGQIAVDEETLQQITKWMAFGETGCSSLAIVQGTTGIPTGRQDTPSDPSDLRRCVQLLEAVPALRQRLHLMRSVSPGWAALVDAWDDITETLAREMRERSDGMGRETYAKMLRLRGEAS